jgi:general secretion pathway protein A
MYAEYWGLVDTPFASQVDARWFYESPAHEEAVARLLFLIEERRRCGVLFGPGGIGKSIVFETLTRQLRRTQRQVALIDALGRTGHELLWEINAALGLTPKVRTATPLLWRALQDHLHGCQSARLQTVLFLDHLERAADGVWETLERLVHCLGSTDQWLTIIVGVRSDSLRQYANRLREISDLRVELPPLDPEQTKAYVEALLQKAEGREGIFDRSAFEALFHESQGIPRELNRLCDLALLTGMADSRKTLGEQFISAAAEDLHSLSGAEEWSSLRPAGV